MLYVKSAKYIKNYEIEVFFSDGARWVVDLKEHLDEGVFRSLRDLSNFRKFHVHPDLETVVWENGADLAPEFLYHLGKSQNKQQA